MNQITLTDENKKWVDAKWQQIWAKMEKVAVRSRNKIPYTTDENGKGTTTVLINNFSASDKAGHTLVVYEDILSDSGVVLATHADKDDAQQTVTVKKAGIEGKIDAYNLNKNG